MWNSVYSKLRQMFKWPFPSFCLRFCLFREEIRKTHIFMCVRSVCGEPVLQLKEKCLDFYGKAHKRRERKKRNTIVNKVAQSEINDR